MKSKREVLYELTQTEKMLHCISVRFLPFRWGTNTYRECEHDCVYRNARYTYEHLGLRGENQIHRFLEKYDSSLMPLYERLYQGSYCYKSYAKRVELRQISQ